MGDAFRAAGVPAMPLKGAWLAPFAYDPPESRPAADIDLLVPPDRIVAAVTVLHRLGYEEVLRTWKHRTFVRPDNEEVVDLRGEHPENPRPVELHTVWGEAFRGIAFELAAPPAAGRLGAGPDLALGTLHVAAHATVDALERRLRLVALVDLARLAPWLDVAVWERLEAIAAAPHVARFVWPTLALAARELGAPIPPERLARIGREVAPALRAWVDAADVDSLSRFGRVDVPRRLGEVPAIWPLTAAERRAVWRFILWPGRWQLADRYPRLAASRLWPAAYVLHAGYTGRRLTARWRRR